MKGLLYILLLLETLVVQQQVDGGQVENEISQQLSSEDSRQNPSPTHEASTDSQQYCHLSFPDIHAALRELTATVTEQKANIRALETRLREQQTFILEELNRKTDALEMRLRDTEKAAEQQTFILEELNKKTDDREIAFSASLMQSGSGHVGPFTTDITVTYKNVYTNVGNAYNPITGIFTAPLKGAYWFSFSIYSITNSYPSSASIMKNEQRVVTGYSYQSHGALNSSKGVVLILEVGDVVYVSLWSGRRIYDETNNLNTFSGYLLFPLRG
ncbi:Caprin-2 [Labeo rohita]|uniref:Caprin-2 n=1 Tax=Labeo rohita TaxID=84645 RepID=A0ABQ8MDU8_LABRO|nr:Caprin-2 [Labeo rohita]